MLHPARISPTRRPRHTRSVPTGRAGKLTPTSPTIRRTSNTDMELFLDILLIVTSLLLILLVLLHRGKGGGLSSLFGGGVQSNLSGSTVAEKNLDRLTVFTGIIWVISILGIGLQIKFS
ncbi:protein translocase, SecG subunit [Rhodococcus pyridinivorans]|nr:protein translocase, SecG subunit [Rhodococcus pyridinivorans]